MIVVVVARRDDGGGRWRRCGCAGGRRGGRGGAIALGGAAAPVGGGRGDGRGFSARGRGGHHGGPAREGAARGGGGGDEHAAPPAGRGGGRGVDASLDAPAPGGGGGVSSAGQRVREDLSDWFAFNGNPNRKGESSGWSSAKLVESDKHQKLPKQPAALTVRQEPTFLPFNEQEVFYNYLEAQSTAVEDAIDDLLIIFESIACVRKRLYEMVCKVRTANDQSSLGKEMREESKRANQLLKSAEVKVTDIKDMGGVPVAIPAHFYTDVKPRKP